MVVVDFFDHDPPAGTALQATANVIGHALFLLVNVLNIAFLLIVQWLILGRLQRSNVLKLTLLGCFFQACSCTSSVIRWNIGDPSGPLGIVSCLSGIAAHIPIDIAFIYVFFNRGYATALLKGSVFFIIVGTSLLVLTYVKFETDSFKYLTGYHPISVLWHVVAAFKLRSAYKNGVVSISESIISADSMSKLLLVVPLLDIVAFLLNAVAPPALAQPLTGVMYMNAVLLLVYVGRMDFIEQYRTLP